MAVSPSPNARGRSIVEEERNDAPGLPPVLCDPASMDERERVERSS